MKGCKNLTWSNSHALWLFQFYPWPEHTFWEIHLVCVHEGEPFGDFFVAVLNNSDKSCKAAVGAFLPLICDTQNYITLTEQWVHICELLRVCCMGWLPPSISGLPQYTEGETTSDSRPAPFKECHCHSWQSEYLRRGCYLALPQRTPGSACSKTGLDLSLKTTRKQPKTICCLEWNYKWCLILPLTFVNIQS